MDDRITIQDRGNKADQRKGGQVERTRRNSFLFVGRVLKHGRFYKERENRGWQTDGYEETFPRLSRVRVAVSYHDPPPTTSK